MLKEVRYSSYFLSAFSMMLVDSTNKKLEKVIHISYLVLILHIIICLVVFSKLENDFIILGIWCSATTYFTGAGPQKTVHFWQIIFFMIFQSSEVSSAHSPLKNKENPIVQKLMDDMSVKQVNSVVSLQSSFMIEFRILIGSRLCVSICTIVWKKCSVAVVV